MREVMCDMLVDLLTARAGSARRPTGCYKLLAAKKLAPGVRRLAWLHQREVVLTVWQAPSASTGSRRAAT